MVKEDELRNTIVPSIIGNHPNFQTKKPETEAIPSKHDVDLPAAPTIDSATRPNISEDAGAPAAGGAAASSSGALPTNKKVYRDSDNLRAYRACRVHGCPIDVAREKSYNSRYRICEHHRSASSIVIDGRKQRFCQMCAKFHNLHEFDGPKMSCKKKLEEHNLRRRLGTSAEKAQKRSKPSSDIDTEEEDQKKPGDHKYHPSIATSSKGFTPYAPPPLHTHIHTHTRIRTESYESIQPAVLPRIPGVPLNAHFDDPLGRSWAPFHESTPLPVNTPSVQLPPPPLPAPTFAAPVPVQVPGVLPTLSPDAPTNPNTVAILSLMVQLLQSSEAGHSEGQVEVALQALIPLLSMLQSALNQS